MADTAVRTARPRPRPPLPRPGTGTVVRAGVAAALLLFALFGLPQLLSLYYIDSMTQVAVWSMAALGLGVLVGRVGLVSLGQVAVLAIGAWVAARLLFATTQPYPLVLVEAGLITMLIGTLIGLPALRLRGLYLALITLMLAGAITVVLATANFPNGGHGFFGYTGSLVHIPPIRRPGLAGTDPAYFRYSVVVAARLLFATTQPYPLVLLEAGLITMAIGTIIGLPALRLRGLYLALLTLMVAGALAIVLASTNFPNGGRGFLGYNGGEIHIPPIRRPSIAGSDPAFFRYAVIVTAIMFVLAAVHIRTRPGRAWATIRQSEPAALAAGINVTFYKLWAFALASFITGVAGAVLAGADQRLYSIDFPTYYSITLLAVVLMGGAYNMWGAVVAALLYQLLPAALQDWGVSVDWLTIPFGLGVLQVLTTAPAGLADQFPRDMARLGRLLGRLGRRALGRASPSAGGAT